MEKKLNWKAEEGEKKEHGKKFMIFMISREFVVEYNMKSS